MIRVLHTESSMNLGGQELRVLAEMEGLGKRGFSSVLAARPGSRILAEAGARGIKGYPVRMRGSVDPAAVARVLRIIRSENIDIVNAHGSKDGWSAGIAARLAGRKVVRSRHVANPIRANFFGRLVYGPLCDKVVTTSASIKKAMAENGVPESKIVSVPTGVDTDKFAPGQGGGGFRAANNVPEGARLVGMVSVLRGDKGPDVFLLAGDAVMSREPDVFFVLAGDGWMAGRLREMAEASPFRDRIVMPGYVRDVPSLLSALDLFVLPAKVAEGVPQAVLQAHAMKVPVIASEVGGVSEVAINGRTAITVPPGDPEALSEAIIKLLSSPEKGRSLAEAGHGLVMEKYTLRGMLDEMERIYREVLGPGRVKTSGS